MEEDNQLPLKRVELSLSKFNDVAIPHHLELLRQHKANIIKHAAGDSYSQVRREQAAAARVASRLRALLSELETLRGRVRETDRAAFDARTQRSRDLTLTAIMDYLESAPLNIGTRGTTPEEPAGFVCGSAVSTDSVGVVAHTTGPDDDCDVPVMQLQLEDTQGDLAAREATLRGWGELQRELHALHATWRMLHQTAVAQREQVSQASDNIETAAVNVAESRKILSTAEKLRAGAYGAGGAFVGALAGGPLGLVVGAKAGVAAALAGSLLGYCGARLLGHKRQAQLEAPPPPEETSEEHEDKKDR